MILRTAISNDAQAIAQLHTDSWRITYRDILLDSFLDGDILQNRLDIWSKRFAEPTPNQLVIIAEEDGEMLGFVCLYGADDVKWGSLIDNLHVRPDIKGRGVGKFLINEAFKWSKENYPQCGVYLWVYENNTSARAFYKHLGSEEVENHLHDNPGGGVANAIRCTWSI
jgi:ribosomal protein S18 acetylase RimI-like enzyme